MTRPVKQADLFDAILTVLGMPPDAQAPFLVTRHSLRESARPFRILVLDDRSRGHTRLVRVLEEDGHTVLMARTQAEARTVFAQQPIDVVFAESRWTGLDPGRVITLARSHTHGEPPAVIAIALRWSAAARRRAQQAGIHACLARPLRASSVRRMVQAVRASAELSARPASRKRASGTGPSERVSGRRARREPPTAREVRRMDDNGEVR